MKFLLSNIVIPKEQLNKLPDNLYLERIGKLIYYAERNNGLLSNSKLSGYTDGYLRDYENAENSVASHSLCGFKNILTQWPLSKTVSGSFSSVIIDKLAESIILATDHIGIYPIYYYRNEDGFYISNSIIFIGLLTKSENDEIGILQRTIGEGFSNIGSRSIIKNCKRLLPGEFLKFDFNGELLEKKYDNSLFQEISSDRMNHYLIQKYWKDFQIEMEFCLKGSNKVKVALSGGIDSRVVLGAIPEDKRISCLTFGESDNYETKVARRLARIKKADFHSFFQPEVYFPTKTQLKDYTFKTEAVQICSWLEILENQDEQFDTPLLLGELCEGLPARNIKKYNSREFRQSNFVKHYILNKDYKFEKATPEKVVEWKNKIIKRTLIFYIDQRKSKTGIKISKELIHPEILENLNEIFDRITAHNLPYIELYDELFSWYTYTRMRLSKQVLLANSKFKAYSPAMSLRILRNTSNIHPNLRLNYRFAKQLFRYDETLKKLNSVPTSQAPLVPQSFPDFIKFPVWGLRSKIDSYLIKKSVKNGGKNTSYRLFKSVDWAAPYQLPDLEEKLEAYFRNKEIGEEYLVHVKQMALDRRDNKQWPFANIDIMNTASLNMELAIIKGTEKLR